MDPRQLLAEALRLSDGERAALAGELIQSLDSEVDPDAEAAWSAEIRARLERVDAGTARTVSGLPTQPDPLPALLDDGMGETP